MFYFPSDRCVHIVCKLPSTVDSSAFLLTEVVVRGVSGFEHIDFKALVFASWAPPELDKLSWCNAFTEAHWQAFLARKGTCTTASASGDSAAAGRGDHAAHEPVAFLCSEGMPKSFTGQQVVRAQLPKPIQARYVTVKLHILGDALSMRTLALSGMQFFGLPAAHPLCSVVGTPVFTERARQLMEHYKLLATQTRWTAEADGMRAYHCCVHTVVCAELGAYYSSCLWFLCIISLYFW